MRFLGCCGVDKDTPLIWRQPPCFQGGYHAGMDAFMTPEAGLVGLFLASFLSATLLPGGSEIALLAFVHAHPETTLQAWGMATLGNTLGGVSSYAVARLLPARFGHALEGRHQVLVQRWGAAALVLGWVPIIGDLLCVAAGMLRLPLLQCTLWLALGKGLRYLALLEGWQLLRLQA